VASYGFNNEGT